MILFNKSPHFFIVSIVWGVFSPFMSFCHLHSWAVVKLSYIHMPFIVINMNEIIQGTSNGLQKYVYECTCNMI